MTRILSFTIALMMVLSLLPASAESVMYISAPYTAETEDELTSALLTPVYYPNENGPTIGVTLLGVICVDGLYFRDLDNDRELDPCEDWRLSAEERTADLISRLTLEEKAKILFNKSTTNPLTTTLEGVMAVGRADYEKLLGSPAAAEAYPNIASLSTFSYLNILDGTRGGICRVGAAPAELIAYFNNAIEQTTEYAAVQQGSVAFPYTLISNPINTGYPGTLGMAAAVMGDLAAGGGYDMIARYAEYDGQLWVAEGYDVMYGPMNSLPTDPRWSKVCDTYGEDPEVSAGIMVAIITAYQNGDQGLDSGSVANIIKRFPGDGCSYLGFEGHNRIGQWRLNPTPGSIEQYHLIPFQAAVDAGVSGVMTSYSRAAGDGVRSAPQSYRGVPLPGSDVGTAYDATLIQTLLRETMGFTGFVNTDTYSLDDFAYGVDDLDAQQRIVKELQAGATVFGERDYSAEIVSAVNEGLLDEQTVNDAAYTRILPLMQMGKFDNPYVDPQNAADFEAEVYAATAEDKAEAFRKQYVLLKNTDQVLPLTDNGTKVYISIMTGVGGGTGHYGTVGRNISWEEVSRMFTDAGYQVVEDYTQADIAFLYVNPKLNNIQQIPVIDLVEDLEVDEYDRRTGEKTGDEIDCTTVIGIEEIPEIAAAVHENGGKVIGVINISNPWILTNFEPYCDGLLTDFCGSTEGLMDVLDGTYNPTGKLPVTLVSSNEVIACHTVTENGVTYERCVSPCDVPGYAKDPYIDPAILEQVPGGSYAYCDAEGNYYRVWFGLSY